MSVVVVVRLELGLKRWGRGNEGEGSEIMVGLWGGWWKMRMGLAGSKLQERILRP